MKHNVSIFLTLFFLSFISCSQKRYNLADYGIVPNTGQNMSPLFVDAIDAIKLDNRDNKSITLILPPGRYDFYPENATIREYYISNHDQVNPKSVGLPFDSINNIIFDGQGADLVFHGQMLPISVVGSVNCRLKNFHVDFENPHISQVKVLENDTIAGTIIFETAPWVTYEIRDSCFVAVGEGWEHVPLYGIAFEENTKRLLYRSGDIRLGTRNVTEISHRIVKSHRWKDARLIPGTVIAMRGTGRPAPGIFIANSTNTCLENIQIHYAEGMGVLAQMSENITLDALSVCLRGEDDPRYFTTQADATHFSGCKGEIISKNGLYEGMMDDAINVHGTYLRVIERINSNALLARYMHSQSYGFDWGFQGDSVQFIQSGTMEIIGNRNRITKIEAFDKPDSHGARDFLLTLSMPLDSFFNEETPLGIENLEWVPKVVFTDNVIRNNRARGVLFSTPKSVLIERNLFDHTSGSAILLCGDCNGWYETGACHDVVIRNNIFVNSLTSMFQFTNAIISIYPEIPELEKQQKYFHSNITIMDNLFETFDKPIVYAKSVDGIVIKNNEIKQNTDFSPFHWNTEPFLFERVINENVEGNSLIVGKSESNPSGSVNN